MITYIEPKRRRTRIQGGLSLAAYWEDELSVLANVGVLRHQFRSLPLFRIAAIECWKTYLAHLSISQPRGIMCVRPIFTFLSLCGGAILAKPLQMTTEGSASPANHIDVLPVLNTFEENALSVSCNGALYGFNPNIADCEGAAQMFNPDSDQLLWQERHTGVESDFFPLPFAVFGGKSVMRSNRRKRHVMPLLWASWRTDLSNVLDKAECFFETVIRGPNPSAHASLLQVKRAAAALSLRCAAGGTSQGGIAINIGKLVCTEI